MRILQPVGWPRPKGYSSGIAAKGQMIFASGMIGWDASGKFPAHDFIGQARQALKNIVELLASGNAKPQHVVRMTWYVVDKDEYLGASKELSVVYREFFGDHYPAMTAVQVAGLLEKNARLEIEVTAVIPD
jgi:enamine deaminase RidA (YjgF/YER057c/UK114 family)